MSDNTSVSILIDLRKYRIRIYKSALHLLGNPPYIQLLINPEKMIVAINPVSHSIPGDQTHKVEWEKIGTDNSVEIYSRSFVNNLRILCGELNDGFCYRMDGLIIPSQPIAVFSLNALTKING